MDFKCLGHRGAKSGRRILTVSDSPDFRPSVSPTVRPPTSDLRHSESPKSQLCKAFPAESKFQLSQFLLSAFLPYRPAIDGLRAIAILAVFIFHLNHRWLPGGFVGVDIFFVISGYLITSILLKDFQQGRFSLLQFYQRRIARIFPAYFAAALATILGAWLIYSPQDFASAGANLAAASLSLANMKFLKQGDYFKFSSDDQPYLHCWSLSIEEQFYIFFPFLLYGVLKLTRRSSKSPLWILTALTLISLTACILLTKTNPTAAFYLMPTRAWELLAGGLLAMKKLKVEIKKAEITNQEPENQAQKSAGKSEIPPSALRPPILRPPSSFLFQLCKALPSESKFQLSALGRQLSKFQLSAFFLSLFLTPEGPTFPGFWALLPVIGTIGIIASLDTGVVARILSWRPLVFIGKISYSLYLWHWPVFSLIDYKLYFSSEPLLLALKISITLIAAILSYRFIEAPARKKLNERKSRPLAYATFASAMAAFVIAGILIRRENYVNAEWSDLAKGGLIYDNNPNSDSASSSSSTPQLSVVLMGDSNGSMYGKLLKDLSREHHFKLTVISMAAGDPLPATDGNHPDLWTQSLAIVQQSRPDILILGCDWTKKLEKDKTRLTTALKELEPSVINSILLLDQPPFLPAQANRTAIRAGARPPFFEEETLRLPREAMNAYLHTLQKENGKTKVLDVASAFKMNGSEIRFLDSTGLQVYHNTDHLSGNGAELIRPMLANLLGANRK